MGPLWWDYCPYKKSKTKRAASLLLHFPLLLSRFSRVQLLATPWTAAFQAPLPMGFSRQEYWSGLPLPSPFPPKCMQQRKVMLGHNEKTAVCISGRRCSPDTQSVRTLILGCPDSRTLRNKCLLFKPAIYKILVLKPGQGRPALHWRQDLI